MTTSVARRSSRGQTLVEFALVLPILVGMLIGAFDLGRVVLANDLVANAAREAARYAVVHGGSKFNSCPTGPAGPEAIVPPASGSCPFPSPSTESIKQVARDFAAAGGTSVVVEVCYGTNCTGDTHTSGASGTNARGNPVTVTVRATVSVVAGNFIGIGAFNVSSTSTMLVNS
ncbi:MAG: pilus assembly protein [Chloroflexi bacterium]|nr:pilus assembly protein [Chloroflexota bacterium]